MKGKFTKGDEGEHLPSRVPQRPPSHRNGGTAQSSAALARMIGAPAARTVAEAPKRARTSRRTRTTIETLAAVLVTATLAPSAGFAYHGLRSQDALDAARSLPPGQLVAVSKGLRSTGQDLRSQDALDAARSLPPDQLVAVSEGLRSTASEPRIAGVRKSDGFDWSSAVIGAAGLLGLIGVSLALALGVRQMRRRPAQA